MVDFISKLGNTLIIINYSKCYEKKQSKRNRERKLVEESALEEIKEGFHEEVTFIS